MGRRDRYLPDGRRPNPPLLSSCFFFLSIIVGSLFLWLQDQVTSAKDSSYLEAIPSFTGSRDLVSGLEPTHARRLTNTPQKPKGSRIQYNHRFFFRPGPRAQNVRLDLVNLKFQFKNANHYVRGVRLTFDSENGKSRPSDPAPLIEGISFQLLDKITRL